MQNEARPIERSLRLLELIQNHPGITADRLAIEVGVTDRAVRRHVAILREAGIEIDSERGRYGGYRIGRGQRVAPLLLSSEEALGIVMAVLDGHHDTVDTTTPVGSALDKLLRAVPRPVATAANWIRTAVAAAPDRAAARPDPAVAASLANACATYRSVAFRYHSESGNTWGATVDPWALVVRHGRWYLLCRTERADAPRTYRVDRIEEPVTLETMFFPPPDLDPVATLERLLGAGWEFTTKVVIDAPIEAVSHYLPATLGRLEPIDETDTMLTGTTSNPTWYVEQLARLPQRFQVLGGPELRAACRTLGDRLLTATTLHPPDR